MTDGQDGSRRWELQLEYLDHAKKWVKENEEDPDYERRDLLEKWEQTLNTLEEDPMKLHRELDWVAKYRLIEGNTREARRPRVGLTLCSPSIDLQYHDVRRDKGLYYRLVEVEQDRQAGGRLRGRKGRPTSLRRTPAHTSAESCIRRYPDAITAASLGLDHLRHGHGEALPESADA